jgi:hypothetical protein
MMTLENCLFMHCIRKERGDHRSAARLCPPHSPIEFIKKNGPALGGLMHFFLMISLRRVTVCPREVNGLTCSESLDINIPTLTLKKEQTSSSGQVFDHCKREAAERRPEL